MKIAEARVEDARVLFSAGRIESAAYLCGYAIETALKARICRTLGWAGFPATRKEFERYSSFRTHDLEVLLHLSGMEQTVKARHVEEWFEVVKWDPESRYTPLGSANPAEIRLMIDSVAALVKVL
ncbi:MAG TPA: HEPN domain-containing protein [Thermoanaerobaculia bacterium]|nr:HEPN domain-containing protein [Thermoanaerobaculia bacterium]